MRWFALLLSVFVSYSTVGEAAKTRSHSKVVQKHKSKTKKRVKKTSSDLETNMRFDPHAVRGKYQYSDEALGRVENEKSLDDLFGLRTNFKDRLVQQGRRN